MGLFDSKSLLEKKIDSIINTTDYSYKEQLKSFDFSIYIQKFNSEKLLCDILSSIISKNEWITEKLDYILTMYEAICLNPESIEEEYTFKKILDIYFEITTYFENDDNFLKVVQAFDDKKLVLGFFSFLKTTQWDAYKLNESPVISDSYYKNLSILIGYLPIARQYFVDDRALLSSAIDLFNDTNFSMINSNNSIRCKNLVNQKLSQAMKANGIYDIDQEVLAEVDAKINTSEGLIKKLNDLVDASERKIKSLENVLKETKDEIVKTRLEEIKKIQAKANELLKQMGEDYTKIITEQRASLIEEKDRVISDIIQEIEQRKIAFRTEANTLEQKVAIELRRINAASSDSITRFQNYISNNDEIQKIIKDTTDSSSFVAYLNKMEQIMGPIGTNVTLGPKEVYPASSGIVVPNIVITTDERQVDPTVNYYFDRNIPFKKRFDKLMEAKQRDIEKNGAVYHEKFDDIVKIFLQNDTPYMYGPSGCGKTFMITKQLSKLVNTSVVTNGYVLYEQDVLGYTNSGTGGYVPSNFYRCYKFGDTIFFDELDNGVAHATVVLNHFLGGTEDDYYTFPDGARLKRHSNFRIIAAGNTNGMGRTIEHNTRQKLDESVMQRMTPIEVGYDNRIEKKILENYPNWYNFMINFRAAIEGCSNDFSGEINNIGTFTTRDAESVKRYKDDDCFTDDQLMEYEILENKDIDYLKRIETKLIRFAANGQFTAGGKKLLKLYCQHCEMRNR